MCNKFKKALGNHIRKMRINKAMTQESLSLESNISRSHIAMIETGKRDITVSALFKISRALGVDLKDIFEFDNKNEFKFDIEEIYK